MRKKKEIITKLRFLIELNMCIINNIETKTEFNEAIKNKLQRKFYMWLW